MERTSAGRNYLCRRSSLDLLRSLRAESVGLSYARTSGVADLHYENNTVARCFLNTKIRSSLRFLKK